MSKKKKSTPTIEEVADQANNKTRKRSIQLDFIDNALTVLGKFDQGQGSFYDDYIVDVLYTNLFDKLQDDAVDTNPAATSIYNIYILLGATPRKNTETIQKNYMFYDENLIGPLSDPKTFYLQAIYSMVNFINVSVYLYKKLALIGHEDMQGSMMSFLIVAASNAYEELYSSKGKIEFAYYFKKALQHNANLNIEITKFKSESWKSDFNKLTKAAKVGIDEIIGDNEGTKTINISNISITIGKVIDRRINPDERRYTIEAAITDKEKGHYDRIFISTIKE